MYLTPPLHRKSGVVTVQALLAYLTTIQEYHSHICFSSLIWFFVTKKPETPCLRFRFKPPRSDVDAGTARKKASPLRDSLLCLLLSALAR